MLLILCLKWNCNLVIKNGIDFWLHSPLLIRFYELSTVIILKAALIIILHNTLQYTVLWAIIDNLWCYNKNWGSLCTSEAISGCAMQLYWINLKRWSLIILNWSASLFWNIVMTTLAGLYIFDARNSVKIYFLIIYLFSVGSMIPILYWFQKYLDFLHNFVKISIFL